MVDYTSDLPESPEQSLKDSAELIHTRARKHMPAMIANNPPAQYFQQKCCSKICRSDTAGLNANTCLKFLRFRALLLR